MQQDWGTTPAAIDTCLTVADKYDVRAMPWIALMPQVQVNIHTDTLNESGAL